MTKEQENQFRIYAACSIRKNLYPGYVYVGIGNQNQFLTGILGIGVSDLYMEYYDGKLSNFIDGSSPNADYYVETATWNKIFEKKAESIDSRVALAKQFVGKVIKSKDHDAHGLVEAIEVLFDIPEKYTNGQYPILLNRYKQELAENGSIVILKGKWNCGRTIGTVINSRHVPEIYVEPILIQGHEAVDAGSYYGIGMASISKDKLQRAKAYLENESKYVLGNNIGFRSNQQSITINGVKFTLEILKKLNL